MSENASGEKTEKATPKRMKELRKEGALQRSQDLSAWLGVGAGALSIPAVAAGVIAVATTVLATLPQVIADPHQVDPGDLLIDQILGVGRALAPLFVAVVVTAIVASGAQGGFHIATKKLKPTFKHFNIAKGLKRVFGPQAAWNGVKAALKAGAIGLVLYLVVQSMVPLLLGSGYHSLTQILSTGAGAVTQLVRTAVVAGLALAVIDVLVIVRRNRKQSRMSKKEVKDEHKNTEGDPQVRGAIRSKQMAMSRNRMIAEVADADVVLVNPTHVAVALRYEPGKGAPRVVAKGKGHIAARIRQVAVDKRVTIVEDLPLARALHKFCDVNQEIPAHLYQAVAGVLAFAMALKARGAGTGIHRPPGGPSKIPPPPARTTRKDTR